MASPEFYGKLRATHPQNVKISHLRLYITHFSTILRRFDMQVTEGEKINIVPCRLHIHAGEDGKCFLIVSNKLEI